MSELNLLSMSNSLKYVHEKHTRVLDGIVDGKDIEWLLDCSGNLLTALSDARDRIVSLEKISRVQDERIHELRMERDTLKERKG